MADDTIDLSGSLSLDELLKELRDEEDLSFELVDLKTNPATGATSFGFNSTLGKPERDPADFLKINLFKEADDAPKRASVRKKFTDFGGKIVADGVLRVGGVDSYAIFFRGPEPEFATEHGASTDIESPETLPANIPTHARAVFETGGELAGLPWDRATTVKMRLNGMKDGTMIVFKSISGEIDAFLMVTDADIDTDGPGGSKAIDPTFLAETSLRFANGDSCDSRVFPGVVRSRRLGERPFGLQIGDFAYITFKGKVVACQIYDQGPDIKIGEISIFAARQVDGIPDSMSDREAARGGNFTKELVTLCFPGSSKNLVGRRRAVSNTEIASNAKRCLATLTAQAPGGTSQRLGSGIRIQFGGAGGASLQSPTIFSRSDWDALPPKVVAFSRAPAQGIVIHHTQDENRAPLAGDEEKTAAFKLSQRIQRSHMFERGWSDVGQHFTISRGGIIMEGRVGTLDAARDRQVVRGAHAGSDLHNRQWWGIEMEGDFRQDPGKITDQQRDALTKLCAWLASLIPNFDSNDNIKGHRQVKPGNGTDCPGRLLEPGNPSDFLSQLRTAVNKSMIA